jgi:hypothetical protein
VRENAMSDGHPKVQKVVVEGLALAKDYSPFRT